MVDAYQRRRGLAELLDQPLRDAAAPGPNSPQAGRRRTLTYGSARLTWGRLLHLAAKPFRLRTQCGHHYEAAIQFSSKTLISMVLAQGLEPWTR